MGEPLKLAGEPAKASLLDDSDSESFDEMLPEPVLGRVASNKAATHLARANKIIAASKCRENMIEESDDEESADKQSE